MRNSTRRQWMLGGLAGSCALAAPWGRRAFAAPNGKAQIAITLDLEMSRNFPTWETTAWDYEKGNLDEPTKRYADIIVPQGGQNKVAIDILVSRIKAHINRDVNEGKAAQPPHKRK